ncbi:ABC transporter ATP-binding protein [Herbaspirillum autotrophicum]|uniref:ABC transporter ATP-binding protein n=1 Tax=Herbaspirillum autotrophicum TaxID=180195 RepID=UPI00067B2100|nr:ABC transporter ATP-binding protein [Herbaspirillum autotrophicum]
MTLLSVNGLVKRFGGLVATDCLDLDVRPGEIHAIIGPNGAGKTTLMNQLSGELKSDAGCILFDGQDVTNWPSYRRAQAGMARSFQISSVFDDFSVLENVMLARQAMDGHSFSFRLPVHADRNLTEPALAALATVGLEQLAAAPVAQLAHGARRQLEIAMALATQPKLLLLDEPMAGMSQHESVAVIALLQRLKGQYGIVLVEHDMDAVFALADRITVLVYGRSIACGLPDDIRCDPDVKHAYLGDQEEVI